MYGLAKEHGDSVKVDIENATTPENRQKMRTEFGFQTHGLVIYDGAGRVAKTLDGHFLKEAQIRRALQEVLDGEAPDSAASGAPASGS